MTREQAEQSSAVLRGFSPAQPDLFRVAAPGQLRYLLASAIVGAQPATIPSSYRGRPDGYGSNIPSPWLIQLAGSKRWRRVYHVCWSNSGTSFIRLDGQFTVVDSGCFDEIFRRAGQNREQGQ